MLNVVIFKYSLAWHSITQFPQNLQLTLIAHAKRQQEFNMSTCTLSTIAGALFNSRSGAYFILWFIGSSSVTKRTSMIKLSDLSARFAKPSRLRNQPGWGQNYSVVIFFLFPRPPLYAGKTDETETLDCHCYHSFVLLHLCKKYLTVMKLITQFYSQQSNEFLMISSRWKNKWP